MVDDIVRQDPSALTTSQLQRELATLEQIMAGKLDALEARVDAQKEAQALFHQDLTRVPTAVDRAVNQLKELHEKWFLEKFDSVQVQFKEREIRSDQMTRESKIALDAALASQKEAVSEQNRASALAIAKSETAIAKQLEQLMTLVYSTTGALDSKIGDLKDRVGLIEGRGSGMASSWGIALSIIGVLSMVAAFIFAVKG